MNYLVPRSFLTLEFGRQTRFADMGFDPGRGFDHHYERDLAKLREIAEALILCPIVTLGVVGPNVQLPFLAHYFGVKPLLKLLDDGAIEFKHITGSVALETEGDDTARLSAEAAVRGPENADPTEAARLALDRYGHGISDADCRQLIAKAVARTSLTRAGLPEDAIEIARERYARDAWAFSTPSRGSNEIQIEGIRREVLRWATSYCHSAMIYDESYALLDEKDDWTFAYEAAEACTSRTGIFEASEQVLNKDSVLSFAELLRRGILLPSDIPLLRDKPATDAFRTWLWGELTDGREPAVEWLRVRSIELETGWLRKATIVALAIVKAGATALAKQRFGVEEEITGAAIEVVSDVIVDNAFDHVLSSLQKRNPRNFVHGLATVVGRRAISSGS